MYIKSFKERFLHSHVHSSIIYNSQDRKQPECSSIEEWRFYIYIYLEYSAIKKKEILLFVKTWMDLEGIMLSEISQTKTNTVWFRLYVESNTTTWQQNQTHRKRDQLCGYQRQGVGRGGTGYQEVQTSSFKIRNYWGCNVQHDDHC